MSGLEAQRAAAHLIRGGLAGLTEAELVRLGRAVTCEREVQRQARITAGVTALIDATKRRKDRESFPTREAAEAAAEAAAWWRRNLGRGYSSDDWSYYGSA